jgi:hypothetical protein
VHFILGDNHVGFYDLFILRYSVCTRKPILDCFGLAVSALAALDAFFGELYIAKFIVPDRGDKVNSGIELSYRRDAPGSEAT